MSEQFSEIVDIFSEERSHGQDVGLRALLVDAQRVQVRAAQVVKGGPEIWISNQSKVQ